MWICPSRTRPLQLAALADTWNAHEPDTPLLVRLDEDDPALNVYLNFSAWPKPWTFEVGPDGMCAEKLQAVYTHHPGQPFYGLVADDVRLCTPQGLALLSATAGRSEVAS